ncbi:DNA-formamidopyrimidine glycosylase [Spiroplasma endosymbiont of Anurida maritima]|uniref:DNA-formamidopyrimidine glycosylase n=1 Tax=Spiroplasma endosymbiont of Anurida maritima TaxID=2967972 RepID=UPI0036D383DA
MPELPEVETVCRTLRKFVINKKITDLFIYYNKIIKQPHIEEFKSILLNKTIQNVSRRGKYILFDLDDYVLISHLRMEGKWFYNNKKDPYDPKHVLFVLELDQDFELRYHDTRRFGTLDLVKKEELFTIRPLSNLGLEPFNENFTADYLEEKWKNRNKAIKTLLLEQNVVTGIGNIYVNEILFLSKIYPERNVKNITRNDLENIVKHTKEVLQKSIDVGGTTISSFHSGNIDGKFQNYLYVHGKAKQPCAVCSTIIEKTVVGGRGTYYCPECQKSNL